MLPEYEFPQILQIMEEIIIQEQESQAQKGGHLPSPKTSDNGNFFS